MDASGEFLSVLKGIRDALSGTDWVSIISGGIVSFITAIIAFFVGAYSAKVAIRSNIRATEMSVATALAVEISVLRESISKEIEESTPYANVKIGFISAGIDCCSSYTGASQFIGLLKRGSAADVVKFYAELIRISALSRGAGSAELLISKKLATNLVCLANAAEAALMSDYEFLRRGDR